MFAGQYGIPENVATIDAGVRSGSNGDLMASKRDFRSKADIFRVNRHVSNVPFSEVELSDCEASSDRSLRSV